MAQLVKNPPAMWRPRFDPWVGKIPWRRERLPTPVFWPGEFHGLYSPWGHKESDRTERLSLSHIIYHFSGFFSPFDSFYSENGLHCQHASSNLERGLRVFKQPIKRPTFFTLHEFISCRSSM